MINTDKQQALAKECHATNVKNGFWNIDIPRTLRRLLIITEISEAIEALRKNDNPEKPSPQLYDLLYTDLKTNNITGYKYKFETQIKDTFFDEIADTCIRIFDYCEGLGIRLDYGFVNPIVNPITQDNELWDSFFILLNWIIEADFKIALYHLFKIANYYDFDLIKHIELKNEYNKTREYLHGKQF